MDDLVKRLRSKIFWHTEAAVWMLEAADRIEELEANLALMERKCATLYEGWRISDHSRIDAEAKLAKALEALEYYNVAGYEGKEARTTLAELKRQPIK